MNAVGVASGLVLSLVMLPLAPVLAGAAALARWLGDDEPVRWKDHA
jgi:hypothetical protein